MKKFRLCALMTMLMFVCVCLSGCLGGVLEISIGENGWGLYSVFVGYDKETLLGLGTAEEDLAEMTSLEIDGKTYYGETEVESFFSIEELNALVSASVDEAEANNVETGGMKFTGNEDGSISMTYGIQAGDPASADAELSAEDQAAAEELLESMVIIYDITFPAAVEQVAGPTEGIEIEGSHLRFDTIALAKLAGEEDVSYEFKTASGVYAPEKLPFFSDVAEDAWYYEAIYTMWKKGLVEGVGDDKFAPEDTLTYAEFCQLLAREKDLPTGEVDGYWAGEALAAVIEAGYIEDLGACVPENYDVPIPREAAVAAMYRSLGLYRDEVNMVMEEDIPDYAEIDELYQEDVLGAYSTGITQGVDENKTFKPKDSLTRAEICQLFYNLL